MSTPLEILAQTRDDVARLQGEIGEVTSVNGKVGRVLLDKADIDLGNVDNTSDLNKPISTATQAALDLKATTAALALKADQTAVDLKAPLASPALTGTPTTTTATPLTNNTQIASTAYVDAAVSAGGASFYTFSVTRQSTNQSLGSGSDNSVSFDTEQWDNGALWSISDPERIDISSVTAGKWFFTGSAYFQGDVNGVRNLFIKKNGATIFAIRTNPPGSDESRMDISGMIEVANGDQIRLNIQQTSGSTLLILAKFSGFRVST